MSKRWKNTLREIFTFSKKERVGFVVLLLIVLVVLLYPLVVSDNGKQPAKKSTEAESHAGTAKHEYAAKAKKHTDSEEQSLFQFDPNTADSATFIKLGFSPAQVKSILSYRNTGAWFSKPHDFSKLYVVSEEKFQQLKPYILIEQSIKPFSKVELNSADTTELQRLRGIGPYYARQIARYRHHLGGFYSADQLKEIKGIDDDRFSQFALQCTLDIKLIKPLYINKANESLIKGHPYVTSDAGKKIIEYRRKAPLTSLNQLVEEKIIDINTKSKLEPYIKFNYP